MRRNSRGRFAFALSVLAISGIACSDNVIGPANQLQVTNAADNFQWQVSSLSNVTQTLTYSWSLTGDSANVNQASALTSGTATLTVKGPTGVVRYTSGLQNNGTFHTAKDTIGTWTIEVALSKAGGNLNFRVQKAP